YDLAAGAPAPHQLSRYATGESFWALTVLHRLFPRGLWDVAARRVAHYVAVKRDDEDNFPFPPWPDQWAAYALDEMSTWPHDGLGTGLGSDEVHYTRKLAARFGFLLRTESKRRNHGLVRLI